MTIEVEIANSQSVLELDEQLLSRVVEQTLLAEQVAGATISVALVDNPTLRELNCRHLDHDYDTDVLSFLLECEPPPEIPEGAARGFGKRLEGEVVLSTEMAVQTAESFGWSAQDEVVLYLVHGLLHLVGYDDLSHDEKRVMRERERDILKFFNLTPHYDEAGGALSGPKRSLSQPRVGGGSLSDLLLPFSIGLLWAVGFLAALIAYTLRDFSRSRLDEICRAHANETRFGQILKNYEDTLLGVELLFTLVLLALLPLSFHWWNLWNGPGAHDAPGWMLFTFELLALASTLLLMLLVLPWTIARVSGEPFLYRVWPVLQALTTVVKPFVSLTRQIDQFAHRMADREQPTNGDAATLTDEIRTVVDEGQREGVLETGAGTMIRRVMELQDEDAAAVMTPRTDMVCIQADSSLAEARVKLLEAGHSRVPVIGESTDDIVGILYAKDLLKHAEEPSVSLRDIAREPLYVPETTGIDKLLETMKHEHVHIAIVVDEYGGVAGLVSLEDILEEIVGEIVDEYDSAEEDGIDAIRPGVTEVDARVHIDDLNEQFDFNLPEDGDFDTIGGFVYTQLNRVPDPKDSFTWRQLRFTVLDADKRRIHKLRIEVDESLAASLAEEA